MRNEYTGFVEGFLILQGGLIQLSLSDVLKALTSHIS